MSGGGGLRWRVRLLCVDSTAVQLVRLYGSEADQVKVCLPGRRSRSEATVDHLELGVARAHIFSLSPERPERHTGT